MGVDCSFMKEEIKEDGEEDDETEDRLREIYYHFEDKGWDEYEDNIAIAVDENLIRDRSKTLMKNLDVVYVHTMCDGIIFVTNEIIDPKKHALDIHEDNYVIHKNIILNK